LCAKRTQSAQQANPNSFTGEPPASDRARLFSFVA